MKILLTLFILISSTVLAASDTKVLKIYCDFTGMTTERSYMIGEVTYEKSDKIKKIGLTAKINLQYIKPVPMDTELVVSGKISNHEKRRVEVETVIKADKDILTKANVLYFLPNRKALFKVFGEENFNEKFLSFIMD